MSRRREIEFRRVLKRTVLVAACLALPVIALAQWTTNSNDIYSSNSGNVGIGTSSPAHKLQISGDLAVDSGSDVALKFNDGSAPKWDVYYNHSDGALGVYDRINSAWRMYVANDGNVGIGTTSPQNVLDLKYDGPNALGIDGNSTNSVGLSVANAATSAHAFSLFSSGGGPAPTGYFGIYYNTVGSTRFAIGPTGNVGIGTTTPSSALEIAGDVTVSGNISAKYQDLAEWVPTAQVLTAGTVVSLDTESDNGVIRSAVAYDTRVAGVVSDSPGIVLGQASIGKVKIATTGRVKVHVDTSNGPIRRGDLLVTSEKEGTAMRSEPIEFAGRKIHQPGTLIGKALEPLDDGQGEILVLLSLQ